jgi:hypothetical protein
VKEATASTIELCGAGGFGALVGWYIYYINRNRSDKVQLSDLATLIGTIGGAAITTIFPAQSELFGAYGIGLAVGFFGYFIVLVIAVRRSNGAFTSAWFLDGRCRAPTDDEEKGPTPMAARQRK